MIVEPIAAQHGDRCVCRSCSAQHYLKQLERADYYCRQYHVANDEAVKLRAELARAKAEIERLARCNERLLAERDALLDREAA